MCGCSYNYQYQLFNFLHNLTHYHSILKHVMDIMSEGIAFQYYDSSILHLKLKTNVVVDYKITIIVSI